MEALFENTCFYSKSKLLEMSQKTMRKGFVVYCIVFISLFLAIGIFALILGETGTIVGIILLMAATFLGYRLYSQPRKLASVAYKRNIELYHSEIEAHTAFFEDCFIGKNIQAKSEIKIKYDRVVVIKETKELFLLMLPGNLVILVEKNGFNVGTKEKFLEFIKIKCPAAKLILM